MMNQAILVGTVEAITEDKIIMSVTRNYKDEMTGQFLADLFKVFLPDSMRSNIIETLKEGQTIAVKARLEQDSLDMSSIIVAERVSYL
jgi:hypothetical protein